MIVTLCVCERNVKPLNENGVNFAHEIMTSMYIDNIEDAIEKIHRITNSTIIIHILYHKRKLSLNLLNHRDLKSNDKKHLEK